MSRSGRVPQTSVLRLGLSFRIRPGGFATQLCKKSPGVPLLPAPILLAALADLRLDSRLLLLQIVFELIGAQRSFFGFLSQRPYPRGRAISELGMIRIFPSRPAALQKPQQPLPTRLRIFSFH